MEARAAGGKLAPGPAAIGLCRGVQAFAEGDHAKRVRILEPLMPELVRIGGSHAQRELWEDTFIVACLRGGHGDKAARDDRRAAAPQAVETRRGMAARGWASDAGERRL